MSYYTVPRRVLAAAAGALLLAVLGVVVASLPVRGPLVPDYPRDVCIDAYGHPQILLLEVAGTVAIRAYTNADGVFISQRWEHVPHQGWQLRIDRRQNAQCNGRRGSEPTATDDARRNTNQ